MKTTLFPKGNNNVPKKIPRTTIPFSRLTEAQQREALKEGAEDFSKKFTTIFKKLAKE